MRKTSHSAHDRRPSYLLTHIDKNSCLKKFFFLFQLRSEDVKQVETRKHGKEVMRNILPQFGLTKKMKSTDIPGSFLYFRRDVELSKVLATHVNRHALNGYDQSQSLSAEMSLSCKHIHNGVSASHL